MPICIKNRVGEDGGRTLSCIEEHLTSENHLFACGEPVPRGGKHVPDDQQVCLFVTRTTRSSQG